VAGGSGDESRVGSSPTIRTKHQVITSPFWVETLCVTADKSGDLMFFIEKKCISTIFSINIETDGRDKEYR